jgi:hypothetical protein
LAYKPADSGVVVGSGARMCRLSECLEMSVKHRLFIGLTPSLVVAVPASSRASPLPQVSALAKEFVSDTNHCGSGLARDEARKNTLKPRTKSPENALTLIIPILAR